METSDSNNVKWNIHFVPLDIPDNHWAVTKNEQIYIGTITHQSSKNKLKSFVFVNPGDSRGYRVIVQLWNADMRSTYNRSWSVEEFDTVFHGASLVMQFFASLGCYPQMAFLGNNCMEVADGHLVAGKKEPAMLHVHVLARGVNGQEYIKGIPLWNPPIGQEINMKGLDEEGKRHISWNADQMKILKEQLTLFLQQHFEQEFSSL